MPHENRVKVKLAKAFMLQILIEIGNHLGVYFGKIYEPERQKPQGAFNTMRLSNQSTERTC